MRLTRKKSIELSIELWTWCAETGKEKFEWPEWKKYGHHSASCFLCEYDIRARGEVSCCDCPYRIEFNMSCAVSGSNYAQWSDCNSIHGKKKYAALFLEELKQLRSK